MTALGTRTMVLSIGGTDYTASVSSVTIEAADADSDFTTFADAAAGGAKTWTLKFTAVQDLATATLWDKIWSAAGTSVAAIVKPYGSAAASATTPWYSGNVTVQVPDGTVIGGDADSSTTARFTVDCEWPFDAKPTKAIV